MLLRYVRIENFRGFDRIELDLDEITVLIGENNCGKTSLLEAIRLCLSRSFGRKASPFEDHDYHLPRANSRPGDAGPLKITVRFAEAAPSEWAPDLVQTLADALAFDAQNRYQVTLQVSSAYDQSIRDFVSDWDFLDANERPVPRAKKPSLLVTVQNLFNVYYLTALRDAARDFGPRSTFWGPFLRNPAIPDQLKVQLEQELAALNAKILNADQRLKSVSTNLGKAQQVVTLGQANTVTIDAVPSQVWDLLSRAQVNVAAVTGASLPLLKHGAGTQSLASIFLFEAFLAAGLGKIDPLASSMLQIEEPEAHLHPSAIRSLWPTLTATPGQKIIATHSGDLLSEVPLESIRRLSRTQNGVKVSRLRDADLARKMTVLYQHYVRELKEHNALDFPLLISLAGQLLAENAAVSRHYRMVYPHVCIDEFQDTNVGQFEFLKALVGTDPTGLFVVADDDQIVYQWNGASPERLTDLRNTFNVSVIELPENYRCPKPIIEVANKLISHNPNRAKSSLTPVPSASIAVPEPIRVKSFLSPDEEADWIAGDILRIPHSEREHCAVLGRTKAIVERVASSLAHRNIAATLSVKKNEFVSTPLKWLHAMLRLANSRGDKEQLRKVCKSFYELEGVQLAPKDVVAASSAMGGDLFRAWLGEALARRGSLDQLCGALLLRALGELADKMSYGYFVKEAFDWFEFLAIGDAALSDSDTGEAFADYPEEHKVWMDLCDSINRKHSTDEASLNLLLQEMDLMPKQPPAPPNSVKCYTIHTAKGMEFDNVYVAGLAEDILPSYQSIRKGVGGREIQEERRNCFVAITRTRKCLTLTRSKVYFGYEKQPSRFLREMGLPVG